MAKLTDADLEGKEWIYTYSIPLLSSCYMERRPALTKPAKDGIYLVDFGSPLMPGRSKPAAFLGGVWCGTNKRPLEKQPTHWTAMVEGKGPTRPTWTIREVASGEAA